MRQAIQTTYFSPNVRGSRVRAKAAAGSVTLHWNHALDVPDNHKVAARALAEKFGWPIDETWVQGVLPNGDHVFVMDDGQTGKL